MKGRTSCTYKACALSAMIKSGQGRGRGEKDDRGRGSSFGVCHQEPRWLSAKLDGKNPENSTGKGIDFKRVLFVRQHGVIYSAIYF